MRALVLAIPMVLAASARADVSAPLPFGAHVLVWQDAAFYADAADTAPAVRLATLPARKAGHAVAMRVLSTSGAFVEVEPVDDVDCGWSRLATTDDINHLRLFVKRADLAPVAVKGFAKTFADGTQISLEPGAPVVAQADGWYAAAALGDEFPVELPAASVGLAYEPPKKSKVISGHEFTVTPRTKAGLGDRQLVLNGATATAISKRGDAALAVLSARCVTASVLVPAKSVRELDEDDASIETGGGYGVLDLRGEDYVPAGTALFIDKRQVATSIKPIYLPAPPRGKTVCFDRRLKVAAAILPPATDAADDKLRLCAPAGKVVHEKMRSSASANGTMGK